MPNTANKRTSVELLEGVNLYYEVRGTGPAVLMIAGATGDAGHFSSVADMLSSDYTVITYDRRGNSRSAAGQTATTLEQQADDAARLIRHLASEPATVFGTSGGAIIALKLAMRHPQAVGQLIVHEPPLVGVLPDAEQLGRQLLTEVQKALAAGGPDSAIERFIRDNAGSDVFERLDQALRTRMVTNGRWFFSNELAMFASWVPTPAELRGLHVPVRVLAGRDSRGTYYHRAAEWLAKAVSTELVEVSGSHAPYLAIPDQFAASLAPLLGMAVARS